jgi:hypothetical protein
MHLANLRYFAAAAERSSISGAPRTAAADLSTGAVATDSGLGFLPWAFFALGIFCLIFVNSLANGQLNFRNHVVPHLTNALLKHQCLFPPIGRVIAVLADDRIRLGAKFASKT